MTPLCERDSEMGANDGIWILASPMAELRCGRMHGRVDVSRPQLGVHDLHFDARPVVGELMSLAGVIGGAESDMKARDWPAENADVYVRENDLVATYRPTKRWPFAPQAYWSGEPSNTAGSMRHSPSSLSLLVSVQTDLLDTHPDIRVATRLPAVEVMEIRHDAELTAQALLWRLVVNNLSYLEFVPRSDFSELAIGGDEEGWMTTEWRLFGEFLEKGVIRRARVLSAILPREGDKNLATECCRQFASQPLPLTT
jgi:hypothetical protein